MPETDDMRLLRDYCARQSELAFEKLVHRHVHLVYSTALRQTGNPAQAEEITQAVFIILVRKAAWLRSDTVLPAWLHQTARYAAASYLRGEIRRRQREQEAYMQSALHPSPDDHDWEQLAPLLDEAIGRLGTADRNAVVLRYFQNKSAQEIASTLNVGEAAARKRLTRAIEKLRLHFFRRGVDVSTGALSDAVSAHSVQIAPAGLAETAAAAALLKGSAASASTLALAQGALKIMAWTKVKMAAVVGGALILAAGTAMAINWELNSKALDQNPPVVILRPTQFHSMTGGATSGSKIVLKNVSLRLLLAIAYSFDGTRAVLPTDYPKGNFDFMFTLSGDSTEALKTEIKKQYGLVAHQEIRPANVLLAECTNSNAPGLKITSGRERRQTGNFRDVVFKGVQMDFMTAWLESITQMPVVDQTGLTNFYDITVKWKPKAGQSEADAIRQILPTEFGIELVPTNMPMKMLVVEKVK